jgi:acyl carrier protein
MKAEFEQHIFPQFPKLREADWEQNLFEARLLSSIQFVSLVACIEEAWGLEIDDDEITESNFATLARIAAFIEARRPA